MAEDRQLELYRQHLTGQAKFAYFMLAAAGACIGFAVTKTQDASLAWRHVPLALAVLSWAGSFMAGIRYLQVVSNLLYSNIGLLRIEAGQEADLHPAMIPEVSNWLQGILSQKSDKTGQLSTIQVRLLVIGAVCFLAWHLLEMYLRR
jgi:hypothetical protein